MKTRRQLGNLFGVGEFCTDLDSGIWNVKHVKDMLTKTVVNSEFNCSKFGPHVSDELGWVGFILLLITYLCVSTLSLLDLGADQACAGHWH